MNTMQRTRTSEATTMKLGSETASVMNHLMSRSETPDPEVGMGATILHWTDRTACSVIHVEPCGVVVVREDLATRTDKNGMSDAQSYDYQPNPDGVVWMFKRNRRGQWRQCDRNAVGRWVFSGGYTLSLGVRRAYHDYSF